MPTARATRGNPEDFLPLTPAVFHIMLALADRPSHGYAIVQQIEQLTNGRLVVGEGTLYRSTERMLAEGFIEEVRASGAGPGPDARRRTYRLTPWGLTVARAEGERVVSLAEVVVARKLVTRQSAHKRSRRKPSVGGYR